MSPDASTAWECGRKFVLEPLEPRLLLLANLAFGARRETALTLNYDGGSNHYLLLDSANAVVSCADAADATDGGIEISGSDRLMLHLANLPSVVIAPGPDRHLSAERSLRRPLFAEF